MNDVSEANQSFLKLGRTDEVCSFPCGANEDDGGVSVAPMDVV